MKLYKTPNGVCLEFTPAELDEYHRLTTTPPTRTEIQPLTSKTGRLWADNLVDHYGPYMRGELENGGLRKLIDKLGLPRQRQGNSWYIKPSDAKILHKHIITQINL